MYDYLSPESYDARSLPPVIFSSIIGKWRVDVDDLIVEVGTHPKPLQCIVAMQLIHKRNSYYIIFAGGLCL
jgi:hypothetical protein